MGTEINSDVESPANITLALPSRVLPLFNLYSYPNDIALFPR